jgi:hypothetical protein
MLAYVFVHQPAGDAGEEGYASRLAGFDQALAAAPPPGFIEPWVWKLAAGPFGEAFEDWYLVEDWAALGTLNQVAVTDDRKAPHDEITSLAVSGAGAIYQLVYGGKRNPTATYRTRVAKPIGVPYATFQERLELAAGPDGTVWKRQMALGADLEFLIDTPSRPAEGVLDRPVTALHAIHHSKAVASVLPVKDRRARAVAVLDRLPKVGRHVDGK